MFIRPINVSALEQSRLHTFQAWLVRVLGWDGMLPAAIWILPRLIRQIAPQAPQVVEAIAVILPIIAFFVRFKAGTWHIATNQCGWIVRSAQFIALCSGLLVLAVLDSIVILTNIMPKGALSAADIKAFAGIYIFYLACMILALYPGAASSPARHHRIADNTPMIPSGRRRFGQ